MQQSELKGVDGGARRGEVAAAGAWSVLIDARGVVRSPYGGGWKLLEGADPEGIPVEVLDRVRARVRAERGAEVSRSWAGMSSGRFVWSSAKVMVLVFLGGPLGVLVLIVVLNIAVVSPVVFATVVVLTVVMIFGYRLATRREVGTRWITLVRDAMLAEGRCPSCGYDLRGVAAAGDGCTVCPECGAAWRAPGAL